MPRGRAMWTPCVATNLRVREGYGSVTDRVSNLVDIRRTLLAASLVDVAPNAADPNDVGDGCTLKCLRANVDDDPA